MAHREYDKYYSELKMRVQVLACFTSPETPENE
jgi:hypothetical protein